jgi:hypothetical protein
MAKGKRLAFLAAPKTDSRSHRGIANQLAGGNQNVVNLSEL